MPYVPVNYFADFVCLPRMHLKQLTKVHCSTTAKCSDLRSPCDWPRNCHRQGNCRRSSRLPMLFSALHRRKSTCDWEWDYVWLFRLLSCFWIDSVWSWPYTCHMNTNLCSLLISMTWLHLRLCPVDSDWLTSNWLFRSFLCWQQQPFTAVHTHTRTPKFNSLNVRSLLTEKRNQKLQKVTSPNSKTDTQIPLYRDLVEHMEIYYFYYQKPDL